VHTRWPRWAGEGRRIARQLAALVGEIEGLAETRDIENRLAERLASTTAA
jgi:hypothetical protein